MILFMTRKENRGVSSPPFNNYGKKYTRSKRAYRNGLMYGARFVSYRTVANKKDSYSGNFPNSYIAYFHRHTQL